MDKIAAHELTEGEQAVLMERMREAARQWDAGEDGARTCFSCPHYTHGGDYRGPAYCNCRRSDHYGHLVINKHPACDYWGSSQELVFHGLKGENDDTERQEGAPTLADRINAAKPGDIIVLPEEDSTLILVRRQMKGESDGQI